MTGEFAPIRHPGAVLLERLKRETRPAHERIERDLDLMAPTLSVDRYRSLLIGFFGFYAAWEPSAAAAIADDGFFGPRRKLHLLVQDLAALGCDAAAIRAMPVCPAVPSMPGVREAMGSLYVLEGATLGGQFIACHLERTLGLSTESGGAFFRSYGRQVGPMWQAFRARLAALSSPEADSVVVQSAQATFARLHDWLCGDPQAVGAERLSRAS